VHGWVKVEGGAPPKPPDDDDDDDDEDDDDYDIGPPQPGAGSKHHTVALNVENFLHLGLGAPPNARVCRLEAACGIEERQLPWQVTN